MFAEVIIDIETNALDRVFDYAVPEALSLNRGDRVLVPFGPVFQEGYVLCLKEETNLAQNKIKQVVRKLDQFTAIKPEFFELMEFMTNKYHLRKTSVLKLFISSDMRKGKIDVKTKTVCALNKDIDIPAYFDALRKTATKTKELLMHLIEIDAGDHAILAKQFGASALNKLKADGVVLTSEVEVGRLPSFTKNQINKIELTQNQKEVIEAINKPKTYLLHGVTGSGKTEVYLNLISRALGAGKSAIMLVPEISLTPQMLSVFKARFGDMVAVIHSGLSKGERYDEWRRLHFGEARVVIGARSGVFSPINNVGVIILDEEHEKSYVSETNPRYNTLDVADFRAKYNNCPLVLGSATPDISTYNKSVSGEFELLEMPVRINGKDLPQIQIVDMMQEIRSGNSGVFSNQLLADLNKCINQKNQAMLFINRRGFSSFMMCRECGFVAKCDYCDVSLVYHKAEEKLKCHYCGKQYRALTKCPTCGSGYIRQGAVGTERIVSEIKALFPQLKVLRMDNDTTGTKNSHQKILNEFRNSRPAVLVGTQMIAKGLDFKDVTLAGIIDADQSLYNSDYSSTERTFQLITQMSGRAGRSDSMGKVVLQTYVPKHYVYRFAANYDYKGFYKKEISLRETTSFPPFARIIRILFSCENEELLRENVKVCYNKIQEIQERYINDFYYLNAVKAPLKRIKNKFRYQILARIKLDNADQIENQMFNSLDINKDVSVFFEINPNNLS